MSGLKDWKRRGGHNYIGHNYIGHNYDARPERLGTAAGATYVMPYVSRLCGMYPVYPGGGDPLRATVLSGNFAAEAFTGVFRDASCEDSVHG